MVDAALFVEERDRLRAGAFAVARVHEPHRAGRMGLRQHGAHHFAALIGFGDDGVRVPFARRLDRARGPAQGWSFLFVTWFIFATGGEIEHPDGGPAGHRWRMEYFDCVRDPQAFEQYADEEVRAYEARVKEDEDGEGN